MLNINNCILCGSHLKIRQSESTGSSFKDCLVCRNFYSTIYSDNSISFSITDYKNKIRLFKYRNQLSMEISSINRKFNHIVETELDFSNYQNFLKSYRILLTFL